MIIQKLQLLYQFSTLRTIKMLSFFSVFNSNHQYVKY